MAMYSPLICMPWIHKSFAVIVETHREPYVRLRCLPEPV
ncbi:hypothetical protein IK1_05581 [Bacillus cereus VD146]|uniref:Uncharacterized protein n=1 Tax=Bacillus cereus (strain VD146) TaxID=1053236 RepID=R8NBM0_BACCX|nr:hypothetical protein IK1_05581 [Bacillus cereus VD146]